MSSSFQRDGTLKPLCLLLLVITLWACDGKKHEQPQSTVEKTAKPSVATLIAKQNLRQSLAGTAYGNFMKMKQALADDSLAKIIRLTNETLAILQSFVEHAEQDSLPDLATAAKVAIEDMKRVSDAAGKNQREKLREAITMSEIHLASLRELAGMRRVGG